MPFRNNCGYWTDNNMLLSDFKEHFKTLEITRDTFERYWNSFHLTSMNETKKNKTSR